MMMMCSSPGQMPEEAMSKVICTQALITVLLLCHRGKSISDIGWFMIIMSVLLLFIGAGVLLGP